MRPLAFSLFTNGDDAANHSVGRDTNHSGGRDRRNGPTHGRVRTAARPGQSVAAACHLLKSWIWWRGGAQTRPAYRPDRHRLRGRP